MYSFICTSRVLNKDKSYSYIIQSLSNPNKKELCTSETARMQLKNGVTIKNLKLSSNNRILYHYNDDSNSIIKVSDLIVGHILGQNISTPNSKQYSGSVDSSNVSLAKIGSICSKSIIKKIKHYYGANCTLIVMSVNDVRNLIVSNLQFRHSLACFYAYEMRNTEYMHIERIKSTKAHSAYKYIVSNLMQASFLEQDINLLMILYILHNYHIYTFEHSIDVAIYSCMLYSHIHQYDNKFDKYTFVDLFICGLLHDIGKIYIPICILDKNGSLSPKEWTLLEEHPRRGSILLQELCTYSSSLFNQYRLDCFRRERLINGVLMHHKSAIPGTSTKNYPRDIFYTQSDFKNYSEFLHIISVADSFDGMISPRPYRAKRNKSKISNSQSDYIGCEKAVIFLTNDVASGKLNSYVVSSLLNMIYCDSEHDFDDDYGIKITDVMFDISTITNFSDLTKNADYKF